MLDRIRALWHTEPVRVTTLTVSVVVFALAKAGVVVDPQNVGEAVLLILPVLLGGELARNNVSPAVPNVGVPSDDLLPQDVIS